jgi:hypothetical protein
MEEHPANQGDVQKSRRPYCIHPKRAAAAFDVTPETMLRYCTATEKKKTSDEVLDQLADKLLPKPKRDEEE